LYFPEGVRGIGKGWKKRYRTLPFGWGPLYMRFWNAYHEAHGAPGPGKPAYGPHPLTSAEELAFVVPWAWLWPIARHGRSLLHDRMGIAETFGIGTNAPRKNDEKNISLGLDDRGIGHERLRQ
jgi:hypothetical protein